MSKLVKQLIEQYISSTEQMDEVMKKIASSTKKYEKEKDSRNQFILNVLGKVVYNKLVKNGSMGTFAPIPLSALRLNMSDFQKICSINKKNLTNDDISTIANLVNASYKRNLFVFRGEQLETDIVLQTMDSVIDFFNTLIRSFLKITKTPIKDITNFDVKPIVQKLKKYLD